MTDSVVVVTGAGRGIGRAISERFGREGWQVVAASRTVAELEETRRSIEDAGGRCHIQVVDVCVTDDLDDLIERTVERWGRIDVLVNNAGVAPQANILELDPSLFEAILAVNVRAVYHASRAVWPVMVRQGGGAIVNISSVAAVDPLPGFTGYGASKAWVSAWCRGLADEGKSLGISVFCIAPGAVDTRLLRDLFPDLADDQMLATPDVANLVFAVVHPDYKHSTGQTIFLKR